MRVVRQLAEIAIEASRVDPEGSLLSLREIYRLLDVRGTANSHLANSLNQPPWNGHFRPREIPLKGDEPIYGDYLLFEYCHHDPFVILADCPNLVVLENQLGRILNPYINYAFAFVRGNLAPYRIRYRGTDGAVHVFDKYREQGKVDWRPSIERPHPEHWVEWIEAGATG